MGEAAGLIETFLPAECMGQSYPCCGRPAGAGAGVVGVGVAAGAGVVPGAVAAWARMMAVFMVCRLLGIAR